MLPEGSLIEDPPDLRSFSRLFLNFPFLILGLGFPMICCRIMILSSLSTSSISRSLSSCSLLYRNSSTFFCLRASFVSSSSRLLNSYNLKMQIFCLVNLKENDPLIHEYWMFSSKAKKVKTKSLLSWKRTICFHEKSGIYFSKIRKCDTFLIITDRSNSLFFHSNSKSKAFC